MMIEIKSVLAQLDKTASSLEEKGLKKEAEMLDVISNTLEKDASTESDDLVKDLIRDGLSGLKGKNKFVAEISAVMGKWLYQEITEKGDAAEAKYRDDSGKKQNASDLIAHYLEYSFEDYVTALEKKVK